MKAQRIASESLALPAAAPPAVHSPIDAFPDSSPFPYRDYHNARAELARALAAPRPFYALVTGPSGTGKTCLGRDVKRTLERHRHTLLYIASAHVSGIGITRFVAQSLHVAVRRSALETLHDLTDAIRAHSAQLVLWIDEADRIDPATLHQVRLLAEADVDSPQLLSVVLSGLPSLATQLDAPLLFSLKRRIHLRLRLAGLSRDELDAFLVHRFAAQADRIGPSAREELFERTQAIPALVDAVVHKALLRTPDSEPVALQTLHLLLDVYGR